MARSGVRSEHCDPLENRHTLVIIREGAGRESYEH